MPPSFPTTSPVAVATARILSAYLSNHKLSPSEAASLSGEIADALAGLTTRRPTGLTGGPRVRNEPAVALADEPAPKRPAKPREARVAQTPVATAPALPDLAAPKPEPVADPMPDAPREAERAPIADRKPDDRPAPAPQQPAEAEAEAEAADATEPPRKRKRPSRPRSRRGKGAASASGAMGDDAAVGEAAEHDVKAPPPETEVAAEPVVAGGAAGGEPVVKPKPRRTTGRARRVTE